MNIKGKLELAFHKDRELPVMTDLKICISVKVYGKTPMFNFSRRTFFDGLSVNLSGN